MEARVRQYNVHMRYVAGLAGVKRYPPVPPSVAKERWTGACHRCGQAVTASRAVFSTPGVWSCPSCAVTPLDGARDLLSRTRERAELCGLWAARAPSDRPRVGKGSAPYNTMSFAGLLKTVSSGLMPRDRETAPDLATLTNSEVKPFSFYGLVFKECKVCQVCDGDTVKIIALNPWTRQPMKVTVRLLGIDTEELKPFRYVPQRDAIIQRARLARKRLLQLTTNVSWDDHDEGMSQADIQERVDKNTKILELRCHSNDAFGRVLGWLVDKDTNLCINEVMRAEGHCKAL
eukprot:jgi/Mesvir1/17487/Mv08755-RA.1